MDKDESIKDLVRFARDEIVALKRGNHNRYTRILDYNQMLQNALEKEVGPCEKYFVSKISETEELKYGIWKTDTGFTFVPVNKEGKFNFQAGFVMPDKLFNMLKSWEK
jgi:hypothetical protein